jgi:hypothetical protein
MKAVYIPTVLNPDTDLDKLNLELKNSYTVLWSTPVNKMDLPGNLSGPQGYILLVDNNEEIIENKNLK